MNGAGPTYDACVVGAGFAGIAAAIELARLGRKTVLVERSSALGGVAHTGMHQELCGLYPHGDGMPPATLNAGLSREVAERLLARKGSSVVKVGRVTVLRVAPHELQQVLADLVLSERNLELMFDAAVDAVRVENQSVNRIDLQIKGRQQALGVRAVIDCSAGEVVRLSGAEYELAPAKERQLAAYAVRIEDVTGDPSLLNVKLAYHLSKAVLGGEIGPTLRYSVWLRGETTRAGVLRISVLPSDVGYDLDAVKNEAVRVHDLIKERVGEFKVSRMAAMASMVSEREGIRMIGRYRLVETDVLEGRKFQDGYVKSAWPIEFWDQRTGPEYHYVPDRDHYEIPTRSLCSADIANLFAAGRCISADPRALASARVTGTCLAVGEQSARAASSYLATTGTMAG